MEIKDYYAVLGVTRDATLRDIEAAYAQLRPKAAADQRLDKEAIVRAYETLRDPNLKRKYDADLADGLLSKYHPEAVKKKAEPERFDFSRKRKPTHRLANPAVGVPVLLGLFIVMAAILYWQFGSLIFTPTFANGTDLVQRHTRTAFGTVLRYEDNHAFPHGNVKDAYEIRLTSGDLVWMRKDEINKICTPSLPGRSSGPDGR